MPPYQLHPHSDFPPRSSFIVKASARRVRDAGAEPDAGHILISFRIYNEVTALRWHDLEIEGRRNRLWEHSCFEAFIAPAGTTEYAEVNLAPAKQWATYLFDDYRTGMRESRETTIYRMDFVRRNLSVPRVEMHARLELPLRFRDAEWAVNLSVVIEETDGTKSYWALAHAPGPPDFHNRECFIATLPPPPR